ncbi:MAG: hypothetical protein Kow0075_13360 [Salibacteraceae bacterium]
MVKGPEILSRKEIDDALWDHKVKSSAWFRPYYLTDYLDVACENWQAMVWGDYELLWPVPYKKSPLPQVYQPLLCQQLGPLPTGLQLTSDHILQGWRRLQKQFWRIEIKFNSNIESIPLRHTVHQNFELDLSRPYETIVGEYSRNARSNIKKAIDGGVQVIQTAAHVPQIIETFKLLKGRNIKALNRDYYLAVQHIFDKYSPESAVAFVAQNTNAEFLAGVCVLSLVGRVVYLFSGHTIEARGIGANHLLVDHIIAHYAGKSAILDFEGSDNPGLAFFYQSFGAHKTLYLRAFQRFNFPI